MIGDERDGRVQIKDIIDGTSKTILIVDAKRDIPWTKPEDIEIDADPTKPLPTFGGYFENGLIASGICRRNVEVDFAILPIPKQFYEPISTIAGRKPVDLIKPQSKPTCQ